MENINKYSRGITNNLNIIDMGNSNSSCFFSIPPEEFAIISSLLGILLIDNLNLEQQNSLGNFLVNIGQSLLTAAAQGQTIQSDNKEKNQRIRQQLEELKREIHEIEQELN